MDAHTFERVEQTPDDAALCAYCGLRDTDPSHGTDDDETADAS